MKPIKNPQGSEKAFRALGQMKGMTPNSPGYLNERYTHEGDCTSVSYAISVAATECHRPGDLGRAEVHFSQFCCLDIQVKALVELIDREWPEGQLPAFFSVCPLMTGVKEFSGVSFSWSHPTHDDSIM